MRLPPGEMFVTTDIHEGFKRAGIEITAPEPAAEVGPSRPPGRPSWTTEGGMVQQQNSAIESIKWKRDADARNEDLHQKLAAEGPQRSKEPEATKSQSIGDFVKDSEIKPGAPEQSKGPEIKNDIER